MKAPSQYQALFAACASSATAAWPTAFFLPETLDKPSPTASSTTFSVKPFFTAFLTAFSTFFGLLLCLIIRHISSQLFPPSDSLLHSLLYCLFRRNILGC